MYDVLKEKDKEAHEESLLKPKNASQNESETSSRAVPSTDAIATAVVEKLLRENAPNPSSILQHQRIVAIEQQLLQNQRPPQQSPPSNPPQEQQPRQQVLQEGIPAKMPKSIISVLEQ